MAGKVTTLYEDSAKTNALYPRTKANAVSDSNNNTLTEVGFYTAETVGSGVDDVKVAFDMDLLWTNSSPNTEFPAQTISLDLSEYKAFLLYISINEGVEYSTSFIVKGIETTVYQPVWYNALRTFTFTDSGVVVGSGKQRQSWASSTTSSANTRVIPYKIYGIR